MNRGFTVLAIVAFWVVGAEARADFNLTLEGTLATGQSNAVEIRGDLAYVVGGGYFNILDISDPQDINAISSTELAGTGAGLVVDGDMAYLMEGSAGISIYSVANPDTPVRLGGTSTPGSARSGALVGSLLYVVASDGGLVVVGVANPAAPSQLGSFAQPLYSVYDVAVEGDMAYLMSVRTEYDLTFPNLQAVSLANPFAPALVDSHEYPPQGAIGSVLVHDSVIYMANGNWLVYSATYSSLTGLVPLGELDCPAHSINIDVNGILFASGILEFASVDISQPDAMAILSIITTPRWGGAFNVEAARTFLPQSDHGALLLDLSDPAQMSELAHYFPPGDAIGMTYRDGLLFVAGQQTWVVDVSDPTRMKSVAANGTGVWDWVAQPNHFGVAYVAGIGIRAVDIASGSTLGTVSPEGQELDVSFWGTRVYSAQSTSGFAVLDFSDPADPQQIGVFNGHRINKLAAYQNVLYSAGSGLIEAFDVTDPASPVSTFSAPYTDFIGEMVVEGGRLFVCGGTEGVRIFGLDDPLSPQLQGTLPAQTRTYDVDVLGLMMAVAEPDHGAFLYNIEDPSAPILVGSCSRPGRVDEVALSNRTLFLNVDTEGVYAYAISGVVTGVPSLSASGAFLRAGTNPARSVTEFSFGTAWADDVELAIYDLAGRRVRSFRQQTRPGEPSLITWDGRDDASRSVARGVYVVRLTTSRSTITDKITFMR